MKITMLKKFTLKDFFNRNLRSAIVYWLVK